MVVAGQKGWETLTDMLNGRQYSVNVTVIYNILADHPHFFAHLPTQIYIVSICATMPKPNDTSVIAPFWLSSKLFQGLDLDLGRLLGFVKSYSHWKGWPLSWKLGLILGLESAANCLGTLGQDSITRVYLPCSTGRVDSAGFSISLLTQETFHFFAI